MILVISTCKEPLHENEFVAPVEAIVKETGKNYFIKPYTKLLKRDFSNAKKIIICGTSLQDNEYLCKNNILTAYLQNEHYNKPLLGICAGMQMIGVAYGIRQQVKTRTVGATRMEILKKQVELGLDTEDFTSEFLGVIGKNEVYKLHQTYIDFTHLKEFKIYAGKKIPQAVRHTTRPIYGTLFHPEVRNKSIITSFVNDG